MKQALECKSEKFQLRLNLDAHRISSKNEKGNQIPKINLQRIEQEIAWVDHVLWLATCYFYIKSSTWISIFLVASWSGNFVCCEAKLKLESPSSDNKKMPCLVMKLYQPKSIRPTQILIIERGSAFFPYMNHKVFVMLRCNKFRWSLWRIKTYQEGTQ